METWQKLSEDHGGHGKLVGAKQKFQANVDLIDLINYLNSTTISIKLWNWNPNQIFKTIL